MTDSVTVKQLKKELVERLQGVFPDTEVYEGFLKRQTNREPVQPKLSVMVKEIRTEPVGFSDYLGGGVRNGTYRQEYGVEGKVCFSFRLFLPGEMGESAANDFFLRLCNSLLFWESYDFTELVCKEAEYLAAAQCFSLQMEGMVSLLLTQYEENVLLSDVKITALPEKGGIG